MSSIQVHKIVDINIVTVTTNTIIIKMLGNRL